MDPATSKLALWSVILGLVSVVLPCLLSIPAIILGILGLVQIARNPQTLRGKGMAVTGLVAGGLTTVEGVVLFILLVLMGPMLLLPAVQRSREAAARITSINNMKQIGIACHIHHDNYFMFPSETPDPVNPVVRGKSRLSWRVQILPYLGEETLYKDFHQDESWDSPHNLKLLPRMPKIYLDPRFQGPADQAKGLTYYRGFVGPGSILGASPPTTLTAITNMNGASNTMMIVEAGEPVPWTEPEDPSFNENSPFGGPNRAKTFAVLFADGHVQTIPANFDRQMIRRMINWQNTEPISLP